MGMDIWINGYESSVQVYRSMGMGIWMNGYGYMDKWV